MDIEACVCMYLHSVLDVPAYYDVPEDRPDAFVTVEQTGGTLSALGLGTKSVLVKCWAPSRKEAAAVGKAVKRAVCGIVAMVDITGVRITSEYRDRDFDSGIDRRCLLVEIDVNE